MAASTTVVTDLVTVASRTPTAATKAKAQQASDIDYTGMVSAAQAAIAQAKVSIGELAAATDSADPNATTLGNILLTLS